MPDENTDPKAGEKGAGGEGDPGKAGGSGDAGGKKAEGNDDPKKGGDPESGYYRRQLDKTQKELDGYKAKEREQELSRLSEVDRLKREKQDAETALGTAKTEHKAAIARGEVLAALIEKGLTRAQAAPLIRLVNMSSVEVSDSGEVSAEGVNKQIEMLLKTYPGLFNSNTHKSGGEDFGAGGKGGGGGKDMNSIIRNAAGRT